jgi:hypothetical protein
MFLIVVGASDTVATSLSDPIYQFTVWINDLTLNWLRNFVGSLMLMFDSSCYYHSLVGPQFEYHLTYSFLWPFNATARFIVALAWDIWNLLGTALMDLLRKIDFFGIIIDAGLDISTMAVCFSSSLNVSGNDPRYISLPNQVPDFPVCASDWPGPFPRYGGGCALHTCWDTAWKCVRYNNSITNTLRGYYWFGHAFATATVGNAVSGFFKLIDFIVCPWNCFLTHCSYCHGKYLIYLPACVVNCLWPPYSYTTCDSIDVVVEDPQTQIIYFRTSVYKYGCADICLPCGSDPDAYWECLAECVLSHGLADPTTDPLQSHLTTSPLPWYSPLSPSPPYVSTGTQPGTCTQRLSVEGILNARYAHYNGETTGVSPNGFYDYDFDQWNRYPSPYNHETPDLVYGLLITLMSWGWDPSKWTPSDQNPKIWSTDPTSPNILDQPDGHYWPFIGDDPVHTWWQYKAILSEQFCAGACAASPAYANAAPTAQIEWYMACRAFHTFIRYNANYSPLPDNNSIPRDDCSAEWSKQRLVRDAGVWTDSQGFGAAWADAWCGGGLTLYSLYDRADANISSFQDLLCLPQVGTGQCGVGQNIPRVVYGEPEMDPTLARVLWNTYLSPMHKLTRYWTFSYGYDYNYYGTGHNQNLASCRQTAYPGAIWRPSQNRNAASNRDVLSMSLYFYQQEYALDDPSYEFYSCTQGAWYGDGTYTPGSVSGTLPPYTNTGYVRHYVDGNMAAQVWPNGRPVLQGTQAGFKKQPPPKLSRMPTPAEIKAAEATGRRATGDKEYQDSVEAYHRAQKLGTFERPYRNPTTFASRIASSSCPNVAAATGTAGCYCEQYLNNCGQAETVYGVEGSGSIIEKASFRYCSRAWDAFSNAPDDKARASARDLMCVNDQDTPAIDRLKALLSATLEPAPGVGGDSRILDADALIGPEVPSILEYMSHQLNATAFKRGGSALFTTISDAYTGSWVEKSFAAGVELRARHANPTTEEKLEWGVTTLRGLTSSLAPTTARRARMLAAGRGSTKDVDAKGRSTFARMADAALEMTEAELKRVRMGIPAPEPLVATALRAAGVSDRLSTLAGMFSSIGATFRDSVAQKLEGSPEEIERARLGKSPVLSRLTVGASRLLEQGLPSPHLERHNKHRRFSEMWNSDWVQIDVTPLNRPINATVFSFWRRAFNWTGSTYGPLFSRLANKTSAELNESTAGQVVLRGLRGLRLGATVTDTDAIYNLLGSRIKNWFRNVASASRVKAAMKSIGEYLLRIVTCVYPIQVNTTRPYNIFCFPRFPEGLMSTVPAGPFYPAQIHWAPELVAVDCVNPDYPDRGPYTNPDYPDQVLYHRYYQMYQNPCTLHDSQNRPGCPGSRWCERVHSAENVPLDLVDCGLVTIGEIGKLIHRVLYPNIGAGTDSVDRIHWVLNFALIVLPLPFIWQYFPSVGALSPVVSQLCWALAVWYSWASGILVHGILLLAVHQMVPLFYNIIYWLVFLALFLGGGFSWASPDLLGWAETAICDVTNTGLFSWFPYLAELCTRLTRLHTATGNAVFQMWLLYFAKTATLLLFLYIGLVALFWIAVAILWNLIQFIVTIWTLVSLCVVRRRLDVVERKANEPQTPMPPPKPPKPKPKPPATGKVAEYRRKLATQKAQAKIYAAKLKERK